MMETFAVDKSFYDIASAEELKELFDSDLDPTIHEVLKVGGSSDLTLEWNMLDKEMPTVVLHDKLMTDAALGTRPIKTEHSYSLASDGDSLPDSPMSSKRIDDMEDECFPAIPMNTACTRLSSEIVIKDEPFSETESIHSSCPSPQSSSLNDTYADSFLTETTPVRNSQSILRHTNIMLTANNFFTQKRTLNSQISVKLEPGFQFPPTPKKMPGYVGELLPWIVYRLTNCLLIPVCGKMENVTRYYRTVV